MCLLPSKLPKPEDRRPGKESCHPDPYKEIKKERLSMIPFSGFTFRVIP